MSNLIGGLLNSCHEYVQTHLAQSCFLCAARSRAGLLCPACREDLPALPAARCPVCATPSFEGAVCGACLRRPPAFSATSAVFRYGHPVDILVQRLKYSGQIHLADFMAERMVEVMGHEARPDVIVPMPLHPRRLAERGFNQAALLANHVGRDLGIRVELSACQRVRDTPPQVELPFKARRQNVRGAFSCSADLSGRRVALVDDVMTTGASLDELARVVRRAGAADVVVWVAARAVRE